VSEWRRKATALFPDVTRDLDEGDFALHELFAALGGLAAEAHAADDRPTLQRIHGFAEWCLHQGGELWQAAAIGFYENLFAKVAWSEIVPWLSPYVVAELKKTWVTGFTNERAAELDQLVTTRRRVDYRDHAYATGEIESL
jgi:hypothetical protein